MPLKRFLYGRYFRCSVVLLLIAGGLLLARVYSWARAQSLDQSLEQELAHLAMTDPVAFAAEMENYKTAKDYELQRLFHLGITNPPAYFALLPRTTEEMQQEAAAVEAITRPPTIEQVLQAMTPEERSALQEAVRAINPEGAPVQGIAF